MKTFGGPAILLDRNDINTDEIIPAKYLTEITKSALKPHLLEDLLVDGAQFDNHSSAMEAARVVVTRANFGCGSSREHAVWAFEVNDINIVIAESFARIFRQNMFNCGILAVELVAEDINALFSMSGELTVAVDMEKELLSVSSSDASQGGKEFAFSLNSYDKNLVSAGGWLAFAEANY
ncbi:MAG: 3-isopropylmalate dehydratase small subunit [Thermodesulfobacteriota bacterium]